MIKFNIGLAVNGVDKELDVISVYLTLESQGFKDIKIVKVAESTTETTVVVESSGIPATGPNVRQRVYYTCQALNQDAIAYKINDQGYLVGPKAAEWGGEFKQEFFIE